MTADKNRIPLNYYRSGQPAKPSPFKKRQPTKRRLLPKVADWAIVAVILIAVGYSLIVRPTPSMSLNSAGYRPLDSYRAVAATMMKELKNRNKLTFDEKSIIAGLKKQFPEITDGNISLPVVAQTAHIKLDVALPKFYLNSQGVDFVINSQGTAVARKADMPQVKGLPLIMDQTSFNVNIGQQVLSTAEVSFIDSLIAQCRQSKVPISALIIPPRAAEMDVRTRDRNYFVKFYLAGDTATQIGQFLAARRQFDATKKQPSQYLDVRVSGKVYFK